MKRTIQTTVFMKHNPKFLYHCEIVKGESIRIFGDDNGTRRDPTPFDKTFKIGDWAEWDSWNLRYIGKIVSIGEKTITIQHRYNNEKSRLDLARFAWHNCDFDFDKVEQYNSQESMCI